jgi:hypothetical protein
MTVQIGQKFAVSSQASTVQITALACASTVLPVSEIGYTGIRKEGHGETAAKQAGGVS